MNPTPKLHESLPAAHTGFMSRRDAVHELAAINFVAITMLTR